MMPSSFQRTRMWGMCIPHYPDLGHSIEDHLADPPTVGTASRCHRLSETQELTANCSEWRTFTVLQVIFGVDVI